jgi:hypothetical protein
MMTYPQIDTARELAKISRKELCQSAGVRLKTYERKLARGADVPEHDELVMCMVLNIEKQRKAA